MDIPVTQRWNETRRPKFITPAKTFIPRLHEVAPIGEAEAKAFIKKYHYSGSVPALRRRFGLFRNGRLIGVAAFSHSANNLTLTNAFGGAANESSELGRMVLLDSAEFNAETFLIGYCRRELRREGFRGIISFADPEPRTTATGETVFLGHAGVVYAASSSIYTGRATRSTLHLLPDGNVFSRRAISKIRAGESGHEYASRILMSHGADEPPTCADARKIWLAFWLKKLTRRVIHNGNHRYLIPLQKGLNLPPSLPYPKAIYREQQLLFV